MGERGPSIDDIAAAGERLSRRGVFGFVWLDDDLVARQRYGLLVDFVELGQAICDNVPMLIGLEADICALHGHPEHHVDLPAVAQVGPDGPGARLNISAFWMPPDNGYLLVLSRAASGSDLEVQLASQMRARLMAEAEVVAKSRELENANAELALANRDLEDFAAIISHDLKAPLRAMSYFAEDAEAALTAGDRDCVRENLDKVRAQSKRLSGLLSGLLDYAAIGRKADVAEVVDTRALVEAVAASQPRPAGLDLQIVGDWPTLNTLRAPLDLVLRNLVGNAIKHHDRREGVIRADAHSVRGALVFSISDDGPGIAKRHQEAVFLPFRTLEHGDQSTTDGLGLALVKRTIEAVGGTVDVCSDPDQKRGTSFVVSWPHRIDHCENED